MSSVAKKVISSLSQRGKARKFLTPIAAAAPDTVGAAAAPAATVTSATDWPQQDH